MRHALPPHAEQRRDCRGARRGVRRRRHPAAQPAVAAVVGGRGAARRAAAAVLRRQPRRRVLPADRRAATLRLAGALAGMAEHAAAGLARHDRLRDGRGADVPEPGAVRARVAARGGAPDGARHVGDVGLRGGAAGHRGASLLVAAPARGRRPFGVLRRRDDQPRPPARPLQGDDRRRPAHRARVGRRTSPAAARAGGAPGGG